MTFTDNFPKQKTTIQFIKTIDMPFAFKNARRSKGRHGVSMEETTPLNPNRNDYKDIENPFKMPGEVSKFDKECVQECLTKTIIVVVIIIIAMLFLLICAILQWNGITVPGFRPFFEGIQNTNKTFRN